MAEESDQTTGEALLDAILPRVPALEERMRAGISVLDVLSISLNDVGWGSGRAINLMDRAYPSSRFTGCNFSAEAIDNAKKEAAARRSSRIWSNTPHTI